jgi:hypothetical protein
MRLAELHFDRLDVVAEEALKDAPVMAILLVDACERLSTT